MGERPSLTVLTAVCAVVGE